MSAIHDPMPRPARAFAAPSLGGGLLAGSIDLVFACSFHNIAHGVPPRRVLQAIGSGIFGNASFEMGYASAAAGFVAHYVILIVAAAIYFFASRRLAFLRRHAYLGGMAFGLAIYCTMNYVVLPLSAAPHFKSTTVGALSDFAVHVLLLGPAIALVVRRFDRVAR
ncbi:MAG TPA: hypothetical protein VHE32_04840 [Rhodanobacteraceae bacterium]|nr:hypothetical protein [Rhodanobacteraceae bacterium]